MELQDFIKTKKTDKFIHTSYTTEHTRDEVLHALQNIVEKWLANAEPTREIKERVESELGNYELYSEAFQEKVFKLMSKWGLK